MSRPRDRLRTAYQLTLQLVDQHPRTVVVAGMGAFLVLLVGSYVGLVSRNYSYSGLVNLAPPDGSLALAVGLAWLPALWMPWAIQRPYHAALWLLLLLSYVPGQILPHFVLGSGWELLPLNATLAAGMLLLIAGERIPPLVLPAPRLSARTYRIAIAAGSLVLIAIALAFFGITLALPGLTEVTSTRDEYREELENAPRLVGYAVSWAGRIVLPVAIAAGLWWRRWWLVGLGALGELYIYSVSGFRSLVLVIGLVIAMLLLGRYLGKRSGALLPSIAALGIAIAALPTLVGEWIPLSLAVRRLLDVPGQLVGYYYDYFSTHDPYFLSHSVLGWLSQPPNEADPPSVIGVVYFHDPRVHANGNFWADGMANFGLAGIIVMSLLTVALLVVIDAAARGRVLWLAIAVVSAAIVALTNSGLLTSVATHGVGLAVILVALLPRMAPTATPAPSAVPGG